MRERELRHTIGTRKRAKLRGQRRSARRVAGSTSSRLLYRCLSTPRTPRQPGCESRHSRRRIAQPEAAGSCRKSSHCRRGSSSHSESAQARCRSCSQSSRAWAPRTHQRRRRPSTHQLRVRHVHLRTHLLPAVPLQLAAHRPTHFLRAAPLLPPGPLPPAGHRPTHLPPAALLQLGGRHQQRVHREASRLRGKRARRRLEGARVPPRRAGRPTCLSTACAGCHTSLVT